MLMNEFYADKSDLKPFDDLVLCMSEVSQSLLRKCVARQPPLSCFRRACSSRARLSCTAQHSPLIPLPPNPPPVPLLLLPGLLPHGLRYLIAPLPCCTTDTSLPVQMPNLFAQALGCPRVRPVDQRGSTRPKSQGLTRSLQGKLFISWEGGRGVVHVLFPNRIRPPKEVP